MEHANVSDRSATLGKLFEALTQAQLKITAPMFDKEAKIPLKKGGMFKFRYCSLNAVQGCLKDPLALNGITYMQFPTAKGNLVSVEIIIGHTSGEWVSRVFSLTAASADVKDIGGCVTYAKRYQLCAIFNLTPDEDLDASSVSESYTGADHQKRWLNDKLKELGVGATEMGAFHQQMIQGKLPASDTSILSLIEEGRRA